MHKHYDQLPPINGLNFVPLSPLSFLQRARDTYPDHAAVIYQERQYTWRQVAERCAQLAMGLREVGVTRGDTVSVMAANTPELVEAHYGVAMAGGVLNAINTRLDADTVAYILEHSDCKILLTDSQFSAVIAPALEKLRQAKRAIKVIDIVDAQAPPPEGSGAENAGKKLGEMDYEQLLARGAKAANTMDFSQFAPECEWDALTLNYTSGTSGRPKGVVYHHRGAYLMAMGTIAAWQIPRHPRYLYTVPMFHCNGWGHVWTMAVMGGTIVCNRLIRAELILDAIARYGITHFGGAPIILAMLADAPAKLHPKLDYQVQVMTAGAPPPAAVLEKIERLGFAVTHVYGLTETYGHILYCEDKPDWKNLAPQAQAEFKARQGVRLPMMESARVHSVENGTPVAADGKSLGEIVLRGNTTMKGYYKNPEATTEAFKDGYFHSGDLAVVHPDGYIEIKDRLKDIIISGGENISSIEVEAAIYKHPQVVAAAVVAKAHPKWGETPCAFVELKQNGDESAVDEAQLIAFCRQHLSGFKLPKQVVFMELPKTATGKIQKFKLREMARNGEV